MNKLDNDYLNLCKDILKNGHIKSDRTGTGTISVFGRHIRHKMSDGFPLLTTKEMSLKTIATELRWFLMGFTNIKWLVERGCNIWNGDAYKNYRKHDEEEYKKTYNELSCNGLVHVDLDWQVLKISQFVDKIKNDDDFAKKWGELGPIYGKQWTAWETGEKELIEKNEYPFWVTKTVNQISNLINDLKNNPDSRRLIVNAWNVADINEMILPPCHYGFQCYTRELTVEEREEIMVKKGYGYPSTTIRDSEFEYYNIPKRSISLMFNMRSSDVALGLPYNIASYALLLTMIANEVNMIPDELIGNLGDTHLYSNHVDGINEQMGEYYSHAERLDICGDIETKIKNKNIKELNDYNDFLRNFGSNGEREFEIWLDRKIFEINYFKDIMEVKEMNEKQLMNTLKIPKSNREPFPLPTLEMTGGIDSPLDGSDFKLVNYQHHSKINFPLSN